MKAAVLNPETEDRPPEHGGHLWVWFIELQAGGASNYQELEAWSRMTDTELRPWEAIALISMGKARDSAVLSKSQHGSENKNPYVPATPDVIKGIFRSKMQKKKRGL